ncbi:carboxylate-amine ligase [Leucobacter sp.]
MLKRTPSTAPQAAGSRATGLRTVGVEQELLLVDPRTGAPVAVSEQVLREVGAERAALLESEAKQEQIEVISPPCTALERVAEAILDGRRIADEAAQRVGARAVALGTSVVGAETHLTLRPRYLAMSSQFGITMREQLTCGLHVHVGVESDDEGVAVLDRLRPWLPALLALSGNSPFWRGEETGYHSYRYQAWARWPSAGPTEPFGSAAAYRERVRAMLGTGVVRDPGMVYFDARLSDHLPTVEIRVPDVCMDAEHAVAISALTRALVETAARDWRRGVGPIPMPTAMLRLAMWSASRYGLRERLVDPGTGHETDAGAVVEALMRHAEPALRESGDLSRTAAAVSGILAGGTGSDRQRRVMGESGEPRAVVADAIEVTHRSGHMSR